MPGQMARQERAVTAVQHRGAEKSPQLARLQPFLGVPGDRTSLKNHP